VTDFEHGMVVAARRTGLRISETADLQGNLTASRVYRELSKKKRKYPVSGTVLWVKMPC